ncbi:hypothetical protein V8C44DRAFT_343719 [Trichoderma aethiopicum]
MVSCLSANSYQTDHDTTGVIHYPINEGICNFMGTNGACIWYDNRCVCFGRRGNGVGNIGSIAFPLADEALDDFKDYVENIHDALRNNYDCVKQIVNNLDACRETLHPPDWCDIPDTELPDTSDFDPSLISPLEYTKCWYNFAPLTGGDFGGCYFRTDCEGGVKYCQ